MKKEHNSKTTFWLVASLCILVGTITLISWLTVMGGFNELEERFVRSNLLRAQEVLEEKSSNMSVKLADWAKWDDVYAFAANRNRAFIDANLMPIALENLQIDMMAFFDTRGDVIYFMDNSHASEMSLRVPEDLKEYLGKGSAFLQQTKEDSVLYGVVMARRGPVAIAARPILKTSGKGPARGTMVFARHIDAAELKRLSGIIKVPMDLRRADESAPPPGFAEARKKLFNGETAAIEPHDSGAISGYMLLKDAFGKETMILTVEMPRDISQFGRKTLGYFILALLAVGFIFAAAVYFPLDAEISGRRKAEAGLRESESRFRSYFELPLHGVAITSPDKVWLQVNDRICEILCYSREELLRMTWDELTHPEDLAQDLQLFKSILSGQIDKYSLEKRFVRKDGGFVWTGIKVGCVRKPDGKVDYIVCVIEDITLRKQAEAERERLTVAIEQAGDVVIITDRAGKIQYVNPVFEKLSGYQRSEVVGQEPRVISSGRHTAEFYQTLWRTISSGKTWKGRLVNKKKDGALYTEEATISPVLDAAGTITNYVAVKRDITEQLRLEAQVRQSQKMEAVGLLAGGIAHDFNNILTAIKGYTALVTRSLKPEDPSLADMNEIMNSAERAATLTRQLLAFGRKQILSLKVVDLNTTLDDMANMLRRIIGEEISLSTKIFPAPCLVTVDRSLMEQVIVNLVLNARDAVSKNGGIALETEILRPSDDFFAIRPELARGRMVCLSVRDNGCGIDPEEQKHLFQPFYTTKEQGKGTGLGLSMVYGTVKQSGGEIEVVSAVGKGSTFKLYFPLAAAGAPERAAAIPEEAYEHGAETVLLVDDDETLRRMGERVLRAGGYIVLSAADGPSAIAAAERHGKPLDLLITDVVMPGMSGRELGRELERRRLALRTLYMSGYADEAIVKHGVLEPGIAFIYKPFTVEAFSAKLREVLDGPADQAKA
ncbi:MAG: PAS domain S-box protein [Elusimicrobiales bacterium]|nr:PAS domain S-box protein [Elusimicrobiales bacterium]